MNQLKNILNADDFEGVLNDNFEGLLESLKDNRKFVIPVDDYDGPIEDHWQWVYTGRAMILIENYRRRLHMLGEKLFPGVEFEISSSLYQEL